MQWIMEQSSRLRPWTAEVTAPWTAKRIVHELMALWFGAVHSMGMVGQTPHEQECEMLIIPSGHYLRYSRYLLTP
jgi:hypothetical protein